MRRLLEFGPAAAFYLFALAAQVSGYVSPTVAVVLAIVATLLLFVPACHHSHVWHKARKNDGKIGLDSWYFIVPCLAVAVLAIAGAAYGIGLRSAAVVPETSKDSVPTASQYVRLEKIRRDGGLFDSTKIELVATGTFDRLRIYLDFASSKASMLEPLEWDALSSILIEDWRDVTLGMRKKISIVYTAFNQQPTSKYDYYWGNSELKPDHPTRIIRANNRARIRIYGSDKEPQIFSLLVMRVPFDNEDVEAWNMPVVTVIDLAAVKAVFGPELGQ